MKKNKLNIKFNLSLKLFLLIFLICISTLIGIIINSLKEETIKLEKYTSKDISFTYDNNFEIINEKEYIELVSSDEKASIVIKRMEYTITNQEKDKYEISNSLAFQVIKDNPNYIEIYNSNKNNIYYHLYENYELKKQIEVINIFKDNSIYIIIYSADNNEFDLYKESIDIIVNSINNR